MSKRLLRYLLFVFAALIITSGLTPHLYSRDLRYIDFEKYKVAERVSRHPSFTKGEVRFLVTYNPFFWFPRTQARTFPSVYPRTIFLNPDCVRKCMVFDGIIAHELGHLEHVHFGPDPAREDELEADRFAAGILGKWRLITMRISVGFKRDSPVIKNLENLSK